MPKKYFATDIIKMTGVRVTMLLLVVLYLWGCTTQPKNYNESGLNKPESTIRIASINLANYNKRIGRNDITELVKILKSEQIEVLAVQGISRYPGVSTRIDLVNELSARTDWRSVFGEMLNISGKQTGNAIFSVYPIISHENFSWDKVKSSSFEAALQATVDAGTRPITIVSTEMPARATASEQAQCLKLITTMNSDVSNRVTVVAGNMPTDDGIRSAYSFTEVPQTESDKSAISKIWYSANTSLQLISYRSVETEIGVLLISQFGLSRQQNK
jgi:hypothetical protein